MTGLSDMRVIGAFCAIHELAMFWRINNIDGLRHWHYGCRLSVHWWT